MGGEDAILEFAGVTLGWAQGRARLERFSARLPPGTLAVARTGEGRERLWTAVEEAIRSPGPVPVRERGARV